MNDPHQQYQQPGGYDDREGRGERREQYNPAPSYAPPPQQPQNPNSPPTSASPFAFAPPPLSSLTASASRPALPLHHSEPIPGQYPYYMQQQKMAQPGPAPSYPYASSAPMGYRSYSNESAQQRSSPQTLNRTPSLSIVPTPSSIHSQPSPSMASPYPYQRQVSNRGHPYQRPVSPQSAQHMYPNSYYPLQAAEMPRSLSYPSYAQPYPSPTYHNGPAYGNGLPPLARHNTDNGGMDGMGMRPQMGYSFASRLPLSDRPFKCDECVQSFNRNHDLKRHKRIHLAVKPFGCEKCGKTFSRKDALRRHWLVKGCRGEDGATAPILPMFPVNLSRAPGLEPSSPPSQHEYTHHSGGTSGPPAPLNTLPPRQSGGVDQGQIIVTPDELNAGQQGGENVSMVPLEEPLILDPTLSASSHRGSASSANEGYFEGVVGIKQDGTAAMMEQGNNSPYSRYPTSPSGHALHQYARDGTMSSPNRAQASPTTSQYMVPSRSYSPSNLGPDGKPIFAMPFAPAPKGYSQSADGNLLVPPMEATSMEKQNSADGDPTTWQRWHRNSFPFPPPPGVNYNFDPSSPADANGQSQQQQQQQQHRPSFSAASYN